MEGSDPSPTMAVSVTEADFEAWYRTERDPLVRALWVMGGDRDLAADVVDEAFSRALARWGRVSAMASPGGWVRTVAVNLLRRAMRRRAMERRLLLRSHPAPVATSPAEPDIALWEAVAALPERQRQVVALRYVGDCSEAGIAATLGITEGAVSASLNKARRALAGSLQPNNSIDPKDAIEPNDAIDPKGAAVLKDSFEPEAADRRNDR